MARHGSPRRSSRRFRLAAAGLAALALVAALWLAEARPVRRWWSEHQGLARVEGHRDVLLAAARESGVDPVLLAGVMMVESHGHVDARSDAGALGLFQLMLPTAVERAQRLRLSAPSEADLLRDAALNARLGAAYLAWLLARFEGDEERALIAYNAGPGRLKRWTEEAGSYAAWRDARERAGDSGVLAYARRVQHYRQRFADRGRVAPTALRATPEPAAPEPAAGDVRAAEPGFVGPPAATSQR